MDRILELWIDEGDLAKLLNDRESVAGTWLLPIASLRSVTAGPRSFSRMRYSDPRVFRALEMKRMSRIRRVVAALGSFDSYSSATRPPKPSA